MKERLIDRFVFVHAPIFPPRSAWTQPVWGERTPDKQHRCFSGHADMVTKPMCHHIVIGETLPKKISY
jgi:hypothetical protein